MKLLVLKETSPNEKRVALVPELVAKYKKLDSSLEILVESGAGLKAKIRDEEYQKNEALIVSDINTILPEIDLIISVQRNNLDLEKIKPGCCLISIFNPYFNQPRIDLLAQSQISAFALDLLPRITRAQSMDVLSSQSNLIGYRSVVEGFYEISKVVPMMMTAAGTIEAAKVLVIGAGVAGLQAIATAKRMGAIVYAFDVRKAAKEQVQSLGGKFIEVEESQNDGETKSGYAKEMNEEYKKRQEQAITNQIVNMNLVITTALIPGKKAPILITEEMVKKMKPGSVIIDLAAANGGNCALSKKGETTEIGEVKIIANENIISKVAYDASKLFARNIFNFIEFLVKNNGSSLKQIISFDLNDEIIKSTLLCHQGKVLFKNI